MVAASLVLLALVLGTVGLALGLVQARSAAEAERNAKEAQTAQRLRAEDNEKLARVVLDEIILQQARQRLALYTQEEGIGFAKNPERDKLEHDFLEKGLRFYEHLAQTNATDWAARRERAKAYANVGLLRRGLSNYHASEEAYRSESEKAYRQAIALMEELAGERPDDFDNAYDLADPYRGLFQPVLDAGRLGPAEEIVRHALALYEKLATDFPERRSQTQEGRGYCYWKLADLFVAKAGKPQEVEKAFRRSLDMWAELGPVNPEVPEFWDDVARVHTELALWLGQGTAAEKEHRQALAIWEKLLTKWPERHDYQQHAAWACTRIGELRAAAKETGEAEEFYRRALGAFDKLVAHYPANPFYREEQAQAFLLLAGLLKSAGRAQEAEKASQQSMAIYLKVMADYPEEAFKYDQEGHMAWQFAQLLKDNGRVQEAEKAYRLALAIFRKLEAENPQEPFWRMEQAYTCWLLGGLLKDTGQAQGAEGAYRQAVAIHEKLVAEFPNDAGYRSRLSGNLGELAENLLQQGKHAEAAKVAEKVPGAFPGDPNGYQRADLLLARCAQLAQKDETLPEADRKTLAKTYAERSRELQQHAREAFARAITDAEKLVSESPGEARYREQLAERRTNLVNLLKAMGRTQEVEEIYRQGIGFHGKLAAAHPDMPELWDALARGHYDLGQLLQAAGQPDEAEKAYQQALAIWEKKEARAVDWAARRERARAYANVGLRRLERNNYLESENAYRQAVRLMEELAGERPADFDNAYDLANTYHWFYRPYSDSGRLQPAEESLRHALPVFEKLAADFPDRRSQTQEARGYCQRDLALVLQRAGKPQEAEKAFQQSLGIWAELAAANPKAPGYRNALAYDYGLLGDLYQETGRFSEAGTACEEAQALYEKLAADFPGEPDYQSQAAHMDWHLGGLLKGAAKPEEAEEAYRRALRRFEKLAADYPATAFYRQEHAYTYWQLAWLAKETGRVQEVETAFRQALPILEKLVIDFPDNAEFRWRLSANVAELAENLLRQGKHAEAAKVAEKMAGALAKDANGYPSAALVLARCMALAGKDATLSETDRQVAAQGYADRARELLQEAARRGPDTPAARELREALRRPPDDPQAHYHLGVALHRQGWFAESEAECRQALRLRPDFPEARAKLGYALWKLGKNAEAEAECREALRLRPGDPEATFTLGLVLYWGGAKPAAAARFYAEAFAAHPKLADDVRFLNRYNAACSAARAGCGHGQDAAGLDEVERARLRRQALDWLRADLVAWGQLLEKEPDQARARVQWALRMWQQDTDFAGVRGDALAKLPEAERRAWQQLWADVEQTLKRVDGKDSIGPAR
jgi:tetratricopeptide (TPR) repeat protein